HESIVHRLEQRRRWNRVAEIVAEEITGGFRLVCTHDPSETGQAGGKDAAPAGWQQFVPLFGAAFQGATPALSPRALNKWIGSAGHSTNGSSAWSGSRSDASRVRARVSRLRLFEAPGFSPAGLFRSATGTLRHVTRSRAALPHEGKDVGTVVCFDGKSICHETLAANCGGGRGIRTPGTVSRTVGFKTVQGWEEHRLLPIYPNKIGNYPLTV